MCTLTNASNHTLYGHWTINQYSVTLNKGTGISAVSGAGTYNYDTVRNIDATVQAGYTWVGWTGYQTTGTKAHSFKLPAQNVTLTANATGNPYAVVYNCNNGGQTPPAPTNHIYGTASAVRTNSCSKTGFTFNGWNTAANGSGTAVGNGANITNLTTTYNGTVTLYAQWKVDPVYTGHKYVDLGLSVKWATCNVGATKPEEYGDYFAWAEIQPKESYDWETYAYGLELKKYNPILRRVTVHKEIK